MVNSAVVGLRPTRKGEACILFVACVKHVSFGMDFMANSTIDCPGLTMERNQPAFCLLWEGSEYMVNSTVVGLLQGLLGKRVHQHVFCLLPM